MKIARRFPSREGGMAVIVLLVILSLMLLYILAGTRSMNVLHRELQLIERKQNQHWAATAATNATPAGGVLTSQPAAQNP